MKEISKIFKISLDEIMDNQEFLSCHNKIHFSDIWKKVKEEIKLKITPLNYETWFKDVQIINIEAEKLILLVPLEIYVKILKEKYEELILHCINEFVIEMITKIEYVKI